MENVTIVRFMTLAARQRVYRSKSLLRNAHHDHKIWINEDLANEQSWLDYQARKFYRVGRIKKNWTHLGEVYVQLFDDGPPVKVSTFEGLRAAADSPENHGIYYVAAPPDNGIDYTAPPSDSEQMI